MDEIIVRLARTLACHKRLRILSVLITDGETPPTALAGQLHLGPSTLSAHLAKLTAAGLITRRRSGGWSYCVAESPYPPATLSGMTAAWLRDLLAHPPPPTLPHASSDNVRPLPPSEAAQQLRIVLFEAATAFTDLRRLQILRYLARSPGATGETLCDRLHMSPWALSRHTEKLLRRGYIEAQTTADGFLFRPAKHFRTSMHERLFQIVSSHWAPPPLRTS